MVDNGQISRKMLPNISLYWTVSIGLLPQPSIMNGQRRTEGNDRCPAIEVELQGNETIAEYINEINITKKEWTTPDALVQPILTADSEFLQRYNELIKRRADGYQSQH